MLGFWKRPRAETPNSSPGSVSDWIGDLKAGDAAAAQKLWERYCRRLIGLARSKLSGVPCRASDEEDIALSAFDSFCRQATTGRFPQLDDRDNLWRLLFVITKRKVWALAKQEQRLKRGAGLVLDEAALDSEPLSSQGPRSLEQILGEEPTPDFALQVAEESERLLAALGNEELRSVARWKMEGFTNVEIAGKLGCNPRTIERKLWAIRNLWTKERPL
jgi:DNA-directed RNA polymerase specialized sigma24 family protein